MGVSSVHEEHHTRSAPSHRVLLARDPNKILPHEADGGEHCHSPVLELRLTVPRHHLGSLLRKAKRVKVVLTEAALPPDVFVEDRHLRRGGNTTWYWREGAGRSHES